MLRAKRAEKNGLYPNCDIPADVSRKWSLKKIKQICLGRDDSLGALPPAPPGYVTTSLYFEWILYRREQVLNCFNSVQRWNILLQVPYCKKCWNSLTATLYRARWRLQRYVSRGSFERCKNSAVVERLRWSVVVDDVSVELVVINLLRHSVTDQLTKRVQLTFHRTNYIV